MLKFEEPEVSFHERMARDARAIVSRVPADQVPLYSCTRFDFFAPAYLRIRTKVGGPLVPLVPSPIQYDYLKNKLRPRYSRVMGRDFFRGIRQIIVKPRRMGMTTFIAGLYFFDGLFNPGTNCVICCHLQKVSEDVLQTFHLLFRSLPASIRAQISLKAASKYELVLEFLGPDGKPDPERMPPSTFKIFTEAGNIDLRGVTIHNLLLSEAAHYKNWQSVVNSLVQAVSPDGNVIAESTANGFNHYYDLVQGSLAGRSAFEVVFYAWYEVPEYRLPLDGPLKEIEDPEERGREADLRARGVTDEQLAWRRYKVAEVGSVEQFDQEYPESLLGAFISSGRPYFDSKEVARAQAILKSADRRSYEIAPGIFVWEDFSEDGLYLIAADPSEGIHRGASSGMDSEIGGSDFSAAYLGDVRTMRIVGAIHGRFPPDEFAQKLAWLGKRYGDACLMVERNNHGQLVLYVLEEAGYPLLYRHIEYDAAGQTFLKLGFPTNVATRPLILDTLGALLKRRAFANPDPRFWSEAHGFQRNDAGKPEAAEGRHDDRVMAAALWAYGATLGSRSWGASGEAPGLDRYGLPTIAVARAGDASMSQLISRDGRASAPAAVPRLEKPPLDLPEVDEAPEGSLHAAAMRAMPLPMDQTRMAGPGNPACGNCRHSCGRDGEFNGLCQAHNFSVTALMPRCDFWDLADRYTGGDEPPEGPWT